MTSTPPTLSCCHNGSGTWSAPHLAQGPKDAFVPDAARLHLLLDHLPALGLPIRVGRVVLRGAGRGEQGQTDQPPLRSSADTSTVHGVFLPKFSTGSRPVRLC